MQNQQSSVNNTNQVTIGGAGAVGVGGFPGNQTETNQPGYQGERPDMESDDNEGAEGGFEQQERAEDPGEEFNSRE